MSRSLVIVESPAKARTIGRFFDKNVKVVACMGHVRDLPERQLGIDIKNSFKPRYELTASGKKVVSGLRKEARGVDKIILATDPDREGEAIAWHLAEALSAYTKADFQRVTFHEITSAAVQRAFEEQQQVDIRKVDAQQARRILDRIVGYKVSPLLWKHVGRGTSAGRVQSVALRLVCEREREIQNFKSEEYWNLIGNFVAAADEKSVFSAQLFKLDGKKPVIGNAETANLLAAEIDGKPFTVSDRIVKDKQQRAAPPFITSTLQQIASARLRMTTRQTMAVAQQLYEGMEFGQGEATGLITYMRTDSFAIAKEAQETARVYIEEQYGADYIPAKPNVYRARRAAQEAHEAIRPTDVRRTPEVMARHLTPPQLKLYRLIWQRFVASQMAPAKQRQTSLELKPAAAGLRHDFLFRTTVTETIFPGYMKVFQDIDIDQEEGDEKKKQATQHLPDLQKGDGCRLLSLEKEQSFTQPPNRFSEATLVRELEQNGVGRPSTYASIVNTIQERHYVDKDKGRLIPNELGFKVNDYLTERMDRIFQINFTAEMESQLDAIEEGRENMVHMLEMFYKDFVDSVTDAEMLDAPEKNHVERIMGLFPEKMEWHEPVKVGRRIYDDQKFFVSLREQIEANEKPFSDKQWRALLALAARYEQQIPQLRQVAAELEVADEIEQLIQKNRDKERQVEKPEEADPAVEALLQALSQVKEWQPAQKRGNRVYDDLKFFKSLKSQQESGRPLSQPQIKALIQLAFRYSEKIADFEKMVAAHNLQTAAAATGEVAMDEEEKKKIDGIMTMVEEIKEWNEPRQVRGRTFDDREFIDSVRNQWRVKGKLSPRQIAALRKTIAKYRQQIADYESRADDLNLPIGETGKGESPANKR